MSKEDKILWIVVFFIFFIFAITVVVGTLSARGYLGSEIDPSEYARLREWSRDDTELTEETREAMKDGKINRSEFGRLVEFHDTKSKRDERTALKATLQEP